MKIIPFFLTAIASFGIGFCFKNGLAETRLNNNQQAGRSVSAPVASNDLISLANYQPDDSNANLKLGAFSVSLNVRDLDSSKAFYEKMGFSVFGGSLTKNYLIMKNETTLIGIFEGMFDGTMLTFNPGWDANAKNLATFDDIRVIQKHLKAAGVSLTSEVDENSKGPANFMMKDPDGNIILLDQHR